MSNWEEAQGQTQSILEGLYISFLAWDCLGILQEELDSFAGVRDVWVSPHEPVVSSDKQRTMGGWILHLHYHFTTYTTYYYTFTT